MLLFDGHLDLAMNALEWNRDLTAPLAEIHRREQGKTDLAGRAAGVVSLPAMRRGGIGLCVATQIAHYVSPQSPLAGWSSPEIAWAVTQGQLAWYMAMVDRGEMRQITDLASLNTQIELWSGDDVPEDAPVGFILSLEGADSLLTLDHLHRAYANGLRAVGPAHYGPGVYAPGTGSEGPLEPKGRELLQEMQQLSMILDATHLTDEAFFEALELFDGPVWASHNNCRALVPHQRQFSDEQLKLLIERGAVIGAAMDAWMLYPGWVRFETTPQQAGVTLQTVADHIDHVCQLAGNALHAAIGSDLDGGYGAEQCPADLGSIADVTQLRTILAGRGYSEADVNGIMSGNWIRFLRNAWSRS